MGSDEKDDHASTRLIYPRNHLGIRRTFFDAYYRQSPDALSAFAGHFSRSRCAFVATISKKTAHGVPPTKLSTNIFCKQRGDCGLMPACF